MFGIDTRETHGNSGWRIAIAGSLIILMTIPLAGSAVAQQDTNDDGSPVEEECQFEVPDSSSSEGITSLESRGPDGSPAGALFPPSISRTGRYMLFPSNAEQLTGDSSGKVHFFVRDIESGFTELASVNSSGEPAEVGASFILSGLSADGRFVAFSSPASNLVDQDSNGSQDVFVRDLERGATTRVSVSSQGAEGSAPSFGRDISTSGRWVVFTSRSPEFVDGDTNGVSDVFLHNRETDVTRRISVNSEGDEATGETSLWQVSGSSEGSTSGGGRYTAFSSHASNLVEGDTNDSGDVFVHDRVSGETTRVSVDSAGVEGDSHSGRAAISANGRFVAFFSLSSNLVGGATGGQVYLHDRETGQTSLVSADPSGGASAQTIPNRISISSRGRYVSFDSFADDLTPPDENSTSDVFVRDTHLGITERISLSTSGVEGNGSASASSISRDGRWVAFYSGASNHVAGDINEHADVFLRDRFSAADSESRLYPCPEQDGDPPPDFGTPTYVAMGDSYQSGVGTNQYTPETDIPGTNQCQRSPAAYAPLLFRDDPENLVPGELRFVACSGATLGDVDEGMWNEPSQYQALGQETTLVTIGVGGNDLEFAPVILKCLLLGYVPVPITCESRFDDQMRGGIDKLLIRDAQSRLNPLQEAYAKTALGAPRARIFVLGYPRWFEDDPIFPGWCDGMRYSDQLWINYKISQLSHAIEASALSMGVRFVDLYDASEGHEICNREGNPRFINGRVVPVGQGKNDSFHPTVFGHERIAEELRRALRGDAAGGGSAARLFAVHPGETITTSHVVTGGPGVGFSTSWPGSDVVMSLRTPSGRVIDRDSIAEDVFHAVGPTRENYFINDPEPGEWTIELFGADVDPEGESTTLQVYEMPRPNLEPSARFDIRRVGNAVSVDASDSLDPDGEIVEYIWDFEDGAAATGPIATHTFDKPGTYAVTLSVVDDRGGMDFATVDEEGVVFVPKYDFSGFNKPVADQPAVNDAQAGPTIPIKFRIPGGYGLEIIAAGYPQVQEFDCVSQELLGGALQAETAGGSRFTYQKVGDRYVFAWKTLKGWANTCQRFTLGLDDGGRYSADFKFRAD